MRMSKWGHKQLLSCSRWVPGRSRVVCDSFPRRSCISPYSHTVAFHCAEKRVHTPRVQRRGSSRLETLVWWKVRFVFVFEHYLTEVFGREGGAGELAAPVFLAELCLGLTPALPLLLWVLVGTPWVLLHFLVFLCETLKGNFFKTFPKSL